MTQLPIHKRTAAARLNVLAHGHRLQTRRLAVRTCL